MSFMVLFISVYMCSLDPKTITLYNCCASGLYCGSLDLHPPIGCTREEGLEKLAHLWRSLLKNGQIACVTWQHLKYLIRIFFTIANHCTTVFRNGVQVVEEANAWCCLQLAESVLT